MKEIAKNVSFQSTVKSQIREIGAITVHLQTGFVCCAVPHIPPHSINLAESICQRADR